MQLILKTVYFTVFTIGTLDAMTLPEKVIEPSVLKDANEIVAPTPVEKENVISNWSEILSEKGTVEIFGKVYPVFLHENLVKILKDEKQKGRITDKFIAAWNRCQKMAVSDDTRWISFVLHGLKDEGQIYIQTSR